MMELQEVTINMEEPQRELDDEEQEQCQQLLGVASEQLRAVVPDLCQESLEVAFWALAQSMSHTQAESYLEASEDIMTTVRNGDYARCFYETAHGVVVARSLAPLTFLVDAGSDFIYAHLIDQLLLVRHQQQLLQLQHGDTDHLWQAARDRYERRLQYYKACPLQAGEHNREGRVCPLCWVVYTRVDSQFYKQARARLVGSLAVDFSETIYEYMDLEHLSFQQVLFLCGAQILSDGQCGQAASHYDAVNQWVKVPVWWLLLQ